MKALLLYFLQVVVASGLLYAYYHFFLRNKKFHQYNRYFLLAACLLSILIPFLNIPVYFSHDQAKANFVLYTLSNISTPVYNADPVIINSASQNWFTWQNILYSAYIFVGTLLLLRIILSLRKIRLIIKRNPVEKIEKIRFVNTEEPGTPFSFFRWLFWNKKIELQSEKGEQIFRHELFHIEKKHSLDILFMELLTSILWINPFFHLMKKELKAIHEFLADQFAVRENDKWEYAELLLMQALNTQNHLTNPFFHNQIKRRIAMLTTSTKPGHQYLRKVLVLPVAAIVLALFAFKYKERSELQSAKQELLTEKKSDTTPSPNKKQIKFWADKDSFEFRADSIVFHSDSGKAFSNTKNAIFILNNEKKKFDYFNHKIIIAKLLTVYSPNNQIAINKYDKEAKNGAMVFEDAYIASLNKVYKSGSDTLNPDNKIYEKVEVEASFPGGETAWRRYLERNLSGFNPAVNGAPKGTYIVFIQFVVDKDGKVSDVRPLTHYGYGMEDAAIRLIKKGPYWIPAIRNGYKVKAYRKQPVNFVVTVGEPLSGNTTINEIILEDKSKLKTSGLFKALFVVDGKISDNDALHHLNPEDIKSIQVIKGAPAIAEYGEKGEYGVVKITTTKIKNFKAKEVTIVEVEKVFEKTEVVPKFPGGTAAWRRYLERTLSDFNPADSGATPGTYSVMAQFIVDKDGSLRDIKALTHFGHGMEGKVIEILKKGPYWEPAIQNGRKVSAYVKQPVTFIVQDEKDISSKDISSKNENVQTQERNFRMPELYPNPSANIVAVPINSETQDKGEIKIFDESGNLKITSPFSFMKGSGYHNVNISSLANGVYIITITGTNKTSVKSYKLIKQ